MFLQEIIIDGFKSYAQKTVVSGFDPQFNAITGLNGTGKSNILDSICFVLGITNLTQVRVGNLQELVYKQGQAGISKASVTLIFNNSDVANSPVGYESCKQIIVTRQVVIGGKNKYIVNGTTAQQSQVQNLFHSVQLNVNNPHFLIMQGRITKVLNMKPEEILAMIEEAAGTRMFETKKQAAQKTIEKKQVKMNEITSCIDNEITPTLENLRTERVAYHSWQANQVEYEKLERFCVAFEYRAAEEKVSSAEQDQQKLEEEHQGLLSLQSSMNEKAESSAAKITEIEKLRDSEMEGDLRKLKEEESELSKEVVKFNTTVGNLKESLASEKDSLKTLHKQIDAAAKSIKEKSEEFDACGKRLVEKEGEVQRAETSYNTLRDRYQNACAGVTDETTAELLSLPEQIGVWEKREREAVSQLKQIQQKSEHSRELLKELKKATKQQSQSHAGMMQEVDGLKGAVSKIEDKLKKLNFNEASCHQLQARAQQLKQNNAQLKDKVETLNAALEARLQFNYRDPEAGFDRSRVKGRVAKLFRVADAAATTALEIVAGGKLYQVVVDNEQTAKMLLQHGNFRTNETFIPLNKINDSCLDSERVNRAKAAAAAMGGSAHLALELIRFEPELLPAMKYIFGSTVVCSSSAIAKKVSFDKSIRVRTVTLEGDSYDPSGTITGGSNSQLGVLLCKIEEFTVASEQLKNGVSELSFVDRQLAAMERDAASAKDLSTELDLKRHALRLCEEKMGDSSYAVTMNQIAETEAQLAEMENETSSMKAQQERAKVELKKLKSTETNIKKQRETAMKDMEAQVRNAQKHLSALKAEALKLKNQRDTVQAEIKVITQELKTLQEQQSICESAVSRLQQEIDAMSRKLMELKVVYEDAKAAVVAKNQELNKASKKIKALEAEKEKFLKEAQNASLEARKIAHKLKQWEKDFKDATKAMNALVKQFSWIEREKAYFGVSGSDYDFGAKDLGTCNKRLKEVKADQDRLSKKINKKVMGMIENAEAEYEDLNRKRQVILNDKAKIEAVIEELDIKKAQALEATWQKVNRDFGSIFSMLLPGTTAKLEPPEGCTVMDGLEVKVAFNGVWKDSLTELSGGQRSLLALSLILSLLLFKPAPMYILDEVDAALDLSHTQNIGMMLRTHFSSSQFIVVSLKEGMFNNANVIFRTKFVDGISMVTRTVAGSKAKAIAAPAAAVEEDHEEAESAAPLKKKGKVTKRAAGAENALEA